MLNCLIWKQKGEKMKNLIILILLGVSLSGLAEDMETCECKLPD